MFCPASLGNENRPSGTFQLGMPHILMNTATLDIWPEHTAIDDFQWALKTKNFESLTGSYEWADIRMYLMTPPQG